jgi:hypothetical protein
MGNMKKKCIQNCGQKTEWKRLLGRPKCRWEDNISVDLREIGWKGVDLIHPGSGQGSLGVFCEPSGSVKGREFLEWLSDYKLLKKDSAPWSK